MKCLIVADSPTDRELIIRQLRREVVDLEEAIEIYGQAELAHALQASDIDLVLTEYRLGWTDGLAVLRAVIACCPAVPVIMLTDAGSEEIAAEGFRLGLSDYVLKRHLERLPQAISESLEKARLRGAQAEAIAATRREKADLEARVEQCTRELDDERQRSAAMRQTMANERHSLRADTIRRDTEDLAASNEQLHTQAEEMEESPITSADALRQARDDRELARAGARPQS